VRRLSRASLAPGNVLNPISPRVYFTLAALKHAVSGAFNKSISSNPTPVDFSGEKNLFHTNIKCPIKAGVPITASASASLDVDVDVHASIGIGAVAAGTIIPPKITEFALDFGALYEDKD
jgi:hypothetical protein